MEEQRNSAGFVWVDRWSREEDGLGVMEDCAAWHALTGLKEEDGTSFDDGPSGNWGGGEDAAA